MKTFAALAHTEHLLYRQHSSSPEDWSLVARTTPRVVAEFGPRELVRVQLGSVSLQQLLGMVPWDGQDEAGVEDVVAAFKNASRMDREADGVSVGGVGAEWRVRW